MGIPGFWSRGPLRGFSRLTPPGPWYGRPDTSTPIPLVDIDPSSAGISQLSQTVGGVTNSWRIEANDAGSSTWAPVVGTSLSATGTLTLNTGQPTPSTDVSVASPSSGSAYYSNSSTDLDIGTDDVVIEWYGKGATGSQQELIKATNGTVTLRVEMLGVGFWRLVLDDGVTSLNTLSAISAPAIGDWVFGAIVLDRDGTSKLYLNGVEQSSRDYSSVSGDISPGAISVLDESAARGGSIAYAAAWKGSTASAAYTATVAKNRFYSLIGLANQGSDTGFVGPSTATRSSVAYSMKYNSSSSAHELYEVAINWPRVGTYNDGSETRANVEIEGSAENLCLYSEDFTNAAWTAIDVGDSFGTDGTAPDPVKGADAFIADATDGQHGYTQAITVTAASYTFSVFAKAGDKNFLYLSDDTVANADAYFNLSTGATATTGAGATSAIESFGGGWYRCSITFTGTAASHTFRVASALADSDDTFAGDGSTVNTYAWGAQVELGASPTSYIPTTSAAVTRAADDLEFTITEVAAPLTVTSAFSYNNAFAAEIYTVSDGGSGTDQINFDVTNTPLARIYISSAETFGGGAINAGAPGDSVWVDSVLALADDDVEHYLDGSSVGTDTSVTIPNALDRINYGTTNAGAYGASTARIGRVRIYDSKLAPGDL